MDTLVALSDNCLDALKVGSLSSPISGGSRTILLTSKNNGVLASLHVTLSSIPNGKLLTRWMMDSLRSHLIVQLVDNSGISESTSGHDLEVASASTVGVEVSLLDSVFHKEASGG